MIMRLESDVDSLKCEFEWANRQGRSLSSWKHWVKKLHHERDSAKFAELDSAKLVDEWKTKAGELDAQLMKAKQSEKENSRTRGE